MAKVKTQTIRPIYANRGLEVLYRKRIQAMVKRMADDVARQIERTYKRNEPEMAMDALPARELQELLQRLGREWGKRFDAFGQVAARWLARRVSRAVDSTLKQALRAVGFTVSFKLTRAQRDVFASIIMENVALIKSIPQEYLRGVEVLVQNSVQAGRDISTLKDELAHRYEITERRAAFIARDQNNKATQALARVRDRELGITEGIWVHVPGKKSSRYSHIKMNGKKFKISEGLFDSAEGRKVHCGELPGCQCTYRAIVPAVDI